MCSRISALLLQWAVTCQHLVYTVANYLYNEGFGDKPIFSEPLMNHLMNSEKRVGDMSVSLCCLILLDDSSQLMLSPKLIRFKELKEFIQVQRNSPEFHFTRDSELKSNLLCPLNMLTCNVEYMAPIRPTEKLLVCFGYKGHRPKAL